MVRQNAGRAMLALALLASSCAEAAAGAGSPQTRSGITLRRANAGAEIASSRCSGPIRGGSWQCQGALRLKGGGRLAMREDRAKTDQEMGESSARQQIQT